MSSGYPRQQPQQQQQRGIDQNLVNAAMIQQKEDQRHQSPYEAAQKDPNQAERSQFEQHDRKADESHSPSNSSKKMKKIACVECRQQKAKCDAHERAPNPCTRCTKRNIHCNLKSDYKRTFKRAKIAQMEREYEQMRMRLQTSVTQPLQNASPNYLPPIPSFSPAAISPQVSFQQTGRYVSPSPSPAPLTSSMPHQTYSSSSSQALRFNTHIDSNAIQPVNPTQYTISSISSPPFQSTLQQNVPRPAYSNIAPKIELRNSALTTMAQKQTPPTITTTLSPPNITQDTFNLGPSVRRDIANSHKLFGNSMPKPEPLPKKTLNPELTVCSPKTLGDVTVTSEQIRVLYLEFVENYHTMLPVVDVNKGIERLFRLCPILFWTIIFVALRRHNSDTLSKEKSHTLYFELSPILKSAMAEITISPITRYTPTEVEEPILNASSVYSVQAFLLYTFWPPLTSSLSADTSWNTIGIAIFQAIRIGLHAPGHSSDGMKTNNMDLLKEQIRTWIGCNIVSQTIATAFGFPGFVQLDTSLLVSCKLENSLDIPDSLRQMIEIQLFEEQVAKTMNSNPLDPLRLVDASERIPLLNLLTRELDQLEIKLCSDFNSPLDDLRRLSLYSARLHAFTYNFLDTERVAAFELNRGIVKAYNAAVSVIIHCKEAQNRDKHFIRYLPGVYVLTIWQASCIIAKLIHSPYSSLLDVGAGKEAYQHAIGLTMKASVMKHDMAHRSSGIMRTTWAMFKTLYERSSVFQSVTVRSRMCASVFFDCLWILREKCGMIKLAPKQRSISTVENAIAESDEGSESEEYEDGSNSNSESDEIGNKESARDPSIKGTPNSSVSSHSQAGHKKKYRSLSNTLHPESSARKIINTIPLDPQPISLSENNHENSPSNNSSTKTSPFLPEPQQHPQTQPHISPPDQKRLTSTQTSIKLNNHARTTVSSGNQFVSSSGIPTSNGIKKASPIYPLDSWDLVNDIDSDLLFKDIDSVMNDFGFHAD